MIRAALAAAAALFLSLPTQVAAQEILVIDPGHGGNDPGGTGNGMREKDIVLEVSTKLRDLLQADTADGNGGGSWTVHLTRTNDTFVGLSARASYANSKGAARFVSIHSNAFGDPSANGTETFSYANGTTGARLRNLIQEEMIAAWGLTNRGNKTANFAVLRETAMPAALHELAFITNATDAQKLGSPAERTKAAEAHLRAIQRHFGHDPYIPGAAPAEGRAFGVVSDADGPVAGASVLVDGEERAATGEDGRFDLQLAPGVHSFVATRGEDTSPAVEAEVPEGGEVQVGLMLGAEVDDDGDDPDVDPDQDGDWEPESPGCVCRAGGSGGGASGLLVPMAFAALAFRRRRR